MANLVKYRFRRPGAAVGHIFQTLANTFLDLRAGGDVEQPLIGLGILHNSSRLPLNREHDRAFTLL